MPLIEKEKATSKPVRTGRKGGVSELNSGELSMMFVVAIRLPKSRVLERGFFFSTAL